jgi:Spy/CpxP family protein refolding chaperone
MKSVKLLLSVLALGVMAAVPALRAADEKPAADAPKADAPKAEKGGKGGRMQTPEQQVDRLDQAVGLTAEQKTKVLAIYTKAHDDMQAVAPEDRRTKGREIMQSTRDAVRALLTADQQKKFDEIMQRGPGGGKKKKSAE